MLRATTAVRRGVDAASGSSPKPLVIGAGVPEGGFRVSVFRRGSGNRVGVGGLGLGFRMSLSDTERVVG